MGKSLFLHIGHDKTGSSAIQSSLANSLDELRSFGLVYPEWQPGLNSAGRDFRISTGNLPLGVSLIDFYLRTVGLENSSKQVFSSEWAFLRLLSGDLCDDLSELRRLGVSLHLLLMIRDPVEHAHSLYQQTVKNGGAVGSLDQFSESYERPKEVARLISMLREIGVEPMIRNYSRWSHDLPRVLGQWLGVSPHIFAGHILKRVNRSLSRSELELQLLFNSRLGAPSSAFISDPLVNECADVVSESALWSEGSLTSFRARISFQISDANLLLPAEERYVLPPLDEMIRKHAADDNQEFKFSRDQIETVVKHVSDHIRHCEAQPDPLLFESQEVEAELNRLRHVEHQFLLMQSSKTFRWTRRLRVAYARLRQRLLTPG